MPPQPVKPSIREVLLQEIKAQEAQTRTGGTQQQSTVLEAAARKLGGYSHEAILTQWSELFRTGQLAWGMNLSNPNPPFFHLTARGRQALENATRDRSNPAGYLRHLASIASLNEVAMSYLTEALDCYVAGLFKAGAVMVGGAAESVILDLRDAVVQKLPALGKDIPKGMEDWRLKTVSDALRVFLDGHKARFAQYLRDPFEGLLVGLCATDTHSAQRRRASHQRHARDAGDRACVPADISGDGQARK
jgi:hypothetical protein